MVASVCLDLPPDGVVDPADGTADGTADETQYKMTIYTLRSSKRLSKGNVIGAMITNGMLVKGTGGKMYLADKTETSEPAKSIEMRGI